MNKEEAEEVIKLLLECDGGCEYCVSHLLKLFCKEFAAHIEAAKKAFKEKFDKELDCFKLGK
jgi:hypothetical protein